MHSSNLVQQSNLARGMFLKITDFRSVSLLSADYEIHVTSSACHLEAAEAFWRSVVGPHQMHHLAGCPINTN